MAGVKGRSGGVRPGAGRKPAPKTLVEASGVVKAVPVSEADDPVDIEAGSPLDFLLNVMRHGAIPIDVRLKAATTAAQYLHLRKSDGGKKDEQVGKASKIASGSRFAAAEVPLKLVAGR